MTIIKHSDLVPSNQGHIRYKSKNTFEQGEAPQHWTFLILNTKENSDIIAQKLQSYFSSINGSYSVCDDFYSLDSGIFAPEKGLLAKHVTLRSNIAEILDEHRPRICHTSKWKEDDNLKPMSYDELEKYLTGFKFIT